MNNIRINSRVVTNGLVDISDEISIPGIILYYDMIFTYKKAYLSYVDSYRFSPDMGESVT
jgi:hypothetical protein